MARFLQVMFLTLAYVLVASGVGESGAGAQYPPPTDGRVTACNTKVSDATSPEYRQCLINAGVFTPTQSEESKYCKAAFDEYTKALAEFSKECKGSGLSGDCRDTAEACYEKSGKTEYRTLGAIASQFNLNGIEGLQQKCPTMTYEKWETSHTKQEEKMTTSKEKLVEAKDKVQKATKQYNENNQKLSKEYNDLNKEQAKRALEAKSEKRKAMVDSQEAVRKVQDALFNSTMKAQELRQKVALIYIDKAQKLAEASAAVAKFKCTADLQEKLKKMGTTSASGFSSMMANGSSSRNSTNAVYKACIDTFLIGRQSMIQQYEGQLESLNSQIVNAEESHKNLQDQQKTLQSQSDEIKADLAKSDQDAMADYESRIKEIQTQMQNNYTESVASLKNLNENQFRLEQDVSRTSNSFMISQGEKPEPGAESTYKKAAEKFGPYKNAGEKAITACSCDVPKRDDKNKIIPGTGSPIANTTLCNKKGDPNPKFGGEDPADGAQ